MGARQTKLADSKMSKRTQKHWLKSGKKYVTKNKKFEIHNGIPQEYEEIIKEYKCENYTKFKRTEIKTVYNRSGEPIQERDSKSSLMIPSAKVGIPPDILQTETIKKQPYTCMCKRIKDSSKPKRKSVYSNNSLDSGYLSSCNEKNCQPKSRDNFAKAAVSDQYNIEQKSEKESNDETNDNFLMPSGDSSEFHSIRDVKPTETFDSFSKHLHSLRPYENSTDESASMKSIPHCKSYGRKISLTSLFDERKSSISSEHSNTEIKTRVTDMMPNFEMTHELQSMEQLKLNPYNQSNNVSVKDLKTFEEADDTDEEEPDSNITDVKELSSSYPDSNLCSDSDQLLTRSSWASDESYSVSSHSRQRSMADSTTIAKEVAWYNNLSAICKETPVTDQIVMNAYNISAADGKKSSPECRSNSSGPMMNVINGNVDLCYANHSENRNDNDKDIIEKHIQYDLTNKTLKEGEKDDDLKAAILCIHILTKKDRDYGEETQRTDKSIIDFEVDSNTQNKPLAHKGLTGMCQTSSFDENPPSLEDGPIGNVMYMYVFIVQMILLFCKRKDEIMREPDLSQGVCVEHKLENKADVTVTCIYQRVKSPYKAVAQVIHSTVNNDHRISEITGNTTDTCMFDSVQTAAIRDNDDCSDYAKSKLTLSNSHGNPELQLKETEDSTETYHSQSVTAILENDKTAQNNFVANESHSACSDYSDCFDITSKHYEDDDCIMASRKCSDRSDHKADKKDKEMPCEEHDIITNLHEDEKLRSKDVKSCPEKDFSVECHCDDTLKPCEHEHHCYKPHRINNYLDEHEHHICKHKRVDNYADEHERSEFKLSESIGRENGTVPTCRPMVKSLEDVTECCMLCPDDDTTSFTYDNEYSFDECCDGNSVKSNAIQNKDNSKVDLNENSQNENHTKAADGHCDAHVFSECVVKEKNNLILNATKITDLMKTNRKDELSFVNTAGMSLEENIRIGSTKRDSEGKQIPFENKLKAILPIDLQDCSSEQSVYSSHCSSVKNKIWLRRNKHRIRRRIKLVKKKEGSVIEKNISLTSVERDCKMNTFKQKSLKAKNFCQKCHLSKNRQNKTCYECRIVDGELGSGKFQCQVQSKDDSGISSLLSSIRSTILSEMESIQSIETTKLPGHKKRRKLIKKYFKLGTLSNELQNITKRINDDALLNADHDIVALPGLQSYFDSLRNGGTPSFQEQMRYEWLRLRSFSNYTGGGSPVHLARSGFYHSQNNEIRCFCCNASYSNWVYSDDVQEVHRRISPNCPLVHGGIESNENISIESGTRDNHLQAPANLGSSSGTGVQQATSQTGYSTEKPAAATNHGGFAGTAAQRPNVSFLSTATSGTSASTFSFNVPAPRPDTSGFRFPQTSNQLPAGTSSQIGQSAATVTTTRASGFSFGTASNAPAPAGFTFGQSTSQQAGGSDISSQLRALTLQQSIGAQQPSDEPISGNPVIAPTQPLQIARQTGEGQLSISAQQPPETSDLPQNAARNQRTSESSCSASPAQQNESADTIEIAQLKHPRYRTMDVRMSSFRSWPNYLNQTPRQMAYAGFFHPGMHCNDPKFSDR